MLSANTEHWYNLGVLLFFLLMRGTRALSDETCFYLFPFFLTSTPKIGWIITDRTLEGCPAGNTREKLIWRIMKNIR